MEVPLVNGANEYSMYFTGQSTMTSGNTASVGIGVPCGTAAAKLDVENQTTTGGGFNFTNQYAGRFVNSGSYTAGANDDFVGVKGESNVASVTNNNVNIGGDFSATNNHWFDIGVRGSSVSQAGGSGVWKYGVWGEAQGAGEKGTGVFGYAHNNAYNMGVQGVSLSSGNSTGGYFYTMPHPFNTAMGHNAGMPHIPGGNIGVYGGVDMGVTAGFIAGVYGDAGGVLGSSQNKWAGYFNGNVFSTAAFNPSDNKLKENIQPIKKTKSIELLNAIKPSTYNFISNYSQQINLPQGLQIGVLSEDVVKVLPELTKEVTLSAQKDVNGLVIKAEEKFMTVNYTGFIPLLISAVQSLDSTNQTLLNLIGKQQKQIDALQNCCNFQSTVSSETPKGNVIDLSDLTIILDQNSPNPFAEQTTITYTIPESVKDAKIMFYTVNGVVLKTVQINDRNHGSLTVYGSNLSEGIYTYTLIADGKIIDSKKMICTKK
ncbi:MAG: hypothetical protein RIQ33_700 [Bacteroidota bacterium]|jgi:hypothetical protein